MKKIPAQYSEEAARDIAISALTFLTSDASMLSRFLDATGWTPENLSSSGSRAAILAASLEYLMSEEDLLLTFSANCGLDPSEIVRANQSLQNSDDLKRGTGN